MIKQNPSDLINEILLNFLGIFSLNLITDYSSPFISMLSINSLFLITISLLFNLIMILLIIAILIKSASLIKMKKEVLGYGFIALAALLFLNYFSKLMQVYISN